jgi:mxaL protein
LRRWPRFDHGYRFWLLAIAVIVLAFGYVHPTVPMRQNVFHYLFVVDITQSMNARDYHVKGMPADRLTFAKQALRRVLHDFPCGSEVGLGVFSTKNIMLLLRPLEVCNHYTVIDEVIAHLDWRMAWGADSNIERGVYTAVQAVKKLEGPQRLVFLTDGEQTVDELHRPPLTKVANAVQGLLVGVGGLTSSPLPKLDQNNRLIGYWQSSEVKRSGNDGPSPRSATRPSDPIYRSALNEGGLKRLAGTLGLGYHRLTSVEAFSSALRADDRADQRVVDSDARWLLGLTALLLLVAVYVPDLIRKAGRPSVFLTRLQRHR